MDTGDREDMEKLDKEVVTDGDKGVQKGR